MNHFDKSTEISEPPSQADLLANDLKAMFGLDYDENNQPTIQTTLDNDSGVKNAAKMKRIIDPSTNRLGESLRHSTDAGIHDRPHTHGTDRTTDGHASSSPWRLPDDDELMKELEVMRADYEAFLNSAHPDVAAAMKARLPLSALTIENLKKVVSDRQRQKQ